MIGLRDNLTLSLTKLRTRRVRLIVTLVVSGVLFAVLVAGSLLLRGVFGSVTSFTSDGLGQRFIASVQVNSASVVTNKTYIARAQALEKDRLSQQKIAAAKLGLPFDAATQPPVVESVGPDGSKTLNLNTRTASARQALMELAPRQQYSDFLKDSVKGLKVKRLGAFIPNYTDSEATLTPIVNGAEAAQNRTGYGPGTNSIVGFQSGLRPMDDALMEPFLLNGANLAAGSNGSIPVLAPIDGVEKLLGLTSLPAKADTASRLARLADIRSRANNLDFAVCYRNAAELSRINLAEQQATQAAEAKTTPGYQKPSLMYAVAKTPCSPVVVASDTRTAAEKTAATKQQTLDEQFGAIPPLVTRLHFRIVGVIPALSEPTAALSPSDLISGFFTSTLGYGWFAGYSALIAQPQLAAIYNDPLNQVLNPAQANVEFADRASQKRYLEQTTCQSIPGDPSASPGVKPSAQDSSAPAASDDPCAGQLQNFRMSYGNPLAVLYDVEDGFKKALNVIILILAALSAIVMMGTIGKIIADSRKETSVFRALGAKRLDMTQIYLLYAVILASLAYAVALVLGLAVALWMDAAYGPAVSVQAVLSFNSPDVHKAFHLIAINFGDLFKIYAFTLAVGLVSAALPLLTNLSRNPIKDMREE